MEKNKAAILSVPAGDHGASDSGPVSALERWLAGKLLELAIESDACLVLWNGEEIKRPDVKPTMRVILRDRGALYRLLVDPGLARQSGALRAVRSFRPDFGD